MSLVGTLTKVAIGYAAARGVDTLSGGGGLSALMANFTGAAGSGGTGTGQNPLQAMIAQMAGGMGNAQSGGLAAMMGATAAGGKGLGDMLDNFGKAGAVPQDAEDNAALILRAIIQAAKADGDIDASEKARILEMVGEDADAGDIAFVQEQLAAPVDVESLARDTPDMMKMQVYPMSMMAINVDTQAEQDYMTDLAGALEIDPSTAQMLKLQMGVTR
ncbi:MAG: DUF533 domain-containing protein [Pseudomonadota bacterium]